MLGLKSISTEKFYSTVRIAYLYMTGSDAVVCSLLVLSWHLSYGLQTFQSTHAKKSQLFIILLLQHSKLKIKNALIHTLTEHYTNVVDYYAFQQPVIDITDLNIQWG